MRAAATVRCSTNSQHVSFNLDKKRCRTCSSALEKLCSVCEEYTSYSNAAKHVKRCKKAVPEGEGEAPVPPPRALRVAYLAAAWVDDIPESQYRDVVPDNFPVHFRSLLVEDPTGDARSYDGNDALWGSIFATDARFQLVRTYRVLDELTAAISNDELPEVDVVVINNWIHPTALKDETTGRRDAEELYGVLCRLETTHGLRVFPPLNYAWYFAQKALLLSHFQRFRLPQGAFAIPTLTVPTGHLWKKRVREFVARNGGGESVMLKRELSEMCKHAIAMKCNAISSLEGRNDEGGFSWVAQPLLPEFVEHPEMRMYVLNGRCQWGVATRHIFANGDKGGGADIILKAVAPGRRSWEEDGGREAAMIAEQVAALMSRDQAYAARFLRVDMVRRHGGGWWINELEVFGNAHVHYEAFDNSSDLLNAITNLTKEWVLDMVAPK